VSNTQSSRKDRKAFFAWAAISIFYLFQYVLRVTPGVMVEELRHEFTLTAEQFSTFGAYYLYAYSLLQIPLGILLDRVGVRKVILFSIAVCTIGSFLFGLAEEVWVAQLSRLLIGAGSASAFMGALKVAADHFAPGKRGFFIGTTLTLGTFGALTAGKPLVLLVEATHWRNAVVVCSAVGLAIFLIAYKLLPRYAQDVPHEKNFSFERLFKQIGQVMTTWRVVLFALLSIGLYAPLSVLADLWGTAFFITKFGFEKGQAAQIIMLLYVGLAIGCLIMPGYCEKKGILNLGIRICIISLFVLYSMILYGPAMGAITLSVALLLIGFCGGAEMMCFTGAVSGATTYNTGLIIGFVNTFNMLGGAIIQHLVGFRLDIKWDGAMNEHGVRIYTTEQFTYALSMLVIIVGVSVLLSLFLPRMRKTS